MAIFQRPFGQKNGNIMQASTGAGVTNDNPAIEDVGTGGIQWITERHVACVFLLDTSGSMVANDAIGKLNAGLRTFKEQTISDSSLMNIRKRALMLLSYLLVPMFKSNRGLPL